MSLSAIIAIGWALAATVTAFLPMRFQYPPGLTLLIAAPFVIGFLGYEHGLVAGALALAGFVSMFRRPLVHFCKKAMGRA